MAIEITRDNYCGALISSQILGTSIVVSYPNKVLILYTLSVKSYDRISFATEQDAIDYVKQRAIAPGKKNE